MLKLVALLFWLVILAAAFVVAMILAMVALGFFVYRRTHPKVTPPEPPRIVYFVAVDERRG